MSKQVLLHLQVNLELEFFINFAILTNIFDFARDEVEKSNIFKFRVLYGLQTITITIITGSVVECLLLMDADAIYLLYFLSWDPGAIFGVVYVKHLHYVKHHNLICRFSAKSSSPQNIPWLHRGSVFDKSGGP